MKVQKSRGFTLIELMVVIAIIGVLIAAAIPQYQKYQARSAITTGLDTTRTIKLAYQEYFSLNGSDPTSTSLDVDSDGSPEDYSADNTITCSTFVKEIDIDSTGLLVTFWDKGDGTEGSGDSPGDSCPQTADSIPTVLSGMSVHLIPKRNMAGTTWVVDEEHSDYESIKHLLPNTIPTGKVATSS